MKPNLHLVAALLITGSLVLVGRGTSAASALAQGSSSPAASPVRYGGCQAPHTYIKGDPHAELASQVPPPARPKKRGHCATTASGSTSLMLIPVPSALRPIMHQASKAA
jgi:hypothetical protein